MDDLDVIRLAVVDNITKGRIARTGDESEGKVWKECLKRRATRPNENRERLKPSATKAFRFYPRYVLWFASRTG
jgi:hypothetical protein